MLGRSSERACASASAAPLVPALVRVNPSTSTLCQLCWCGSGARFACTVARARTLSLWPLGESGVLQRDDSSPYFPCAGDVNRSHTYRVQKTGVMECDPWDRCWCLLEMAVRDLAVKERGKARSRIIMSDRSVPKCLTHSRSHRGGTSRVDPSLPSRSESFESLRVVQVDPSRSGLPNRSESSKSI